MKKGECHPIFNLTYLPENIASFFEAIVLATEYLLLVLFIVNFFINIFYKYTHNFVPAIMTNEISSAILARFGVHNSAIGNLLAAAFIVILYVLCYRYFEFIKFNLHPRKHPQKSSTIPQ